MTGIEQMRTLAGAWDEWGLGGALADIADQIEREQRERFDALNDENERLRDMLNGVSYHLGMGEDVHYYSDDNYDECQQSVLRAIDERVKRPSPKVLDADGVEIREGDTVWCTNGHGPFEVTRIVNADRLRVVCDDEENGHLNVYPQSITHRAPVLAADGKPLREGETVWHVNTGIEYSVRSVTNGGAHLSKGDRPGGYSRAGYLTHQRPVLDADGVLVKVGDIVYANADERGDGTAWHVVGIDASLGHSVSAEREDGTQGGARDLRPDWLTHKRSVLDMDDVPIKVGDTVWMTGEPDYGPFTVTNITTKHAWHVYGTSEKDGDLDMPPSELTHTKPEPHDSWERIEKDAAKSTCDYLTNGRTKAAIDGTVQCPDDCPGLTLSSTCREIMAADLVRRAKKLAGVDND